MFDMPDIPFILDYERGGKRNLFDKMTIHGNVEITLETKRPSVVQVRIRLPCNRGLLTELIRMLEYQKNKIIAKEE